MTATPEASAPIPPSVRGARWSAVGTGAQLVADAFIAVAFCKETLRVPMFATGIPCKLHSGYSFELTTQLSYNN